MKRLWLVCMVACGGEHEVPQGAVDGSAMSPPPAVLSVDSVVAGEALSLRVDGANPGDRVAVGVSAAGPGAGPCPGGFGGLCTDIRRPIPLVSMVADGAGVAVATVTVPTGLPTDEVWFQAIGGAGSASYATNVVRRTAYTEPVLPIERCNPAQFPDDPYSTNAVTITGDLLEVDLSYSGGCADHSFVACWDGLVATSFPGQVWVELRHDSDGDLCEAWLTETLRFDLAPAFSPPTVVHVAGESPLYDP